MSNTFIRTFAICLFILASSVCFPTSAQESSSAARKFEEFGALSADDASARLDAFAVEIGEQKNLRGYIVGFREKQTPIGNLLRHTYGYRDYLVNKRGVLPDMVRVETGGVREKETVELWLAPNDAPPPVPVFNLQVHTKATLLIDGISFGAGCLPEYTLALYELDDGLRFYADVLRENPSSNGLIIIYPSRRISSRRAITIARHMKATLVKKYKIEAIRLVTKIGSRHRGCPESELWIMPVGKLARLTLGKVLWWV